MKYFYAITISLLINTGFIFANTQITPSDKINDISINFNSLQNLPELISSLKNPEIKTPNWLELIVAAEKVAAQQNIKTITYSILTRGIITADLSEFKYQANQTLNDSRGWPRLGVNFQEVSSGGNFILVLSEASQMSSFSSGCTSDWSCRVGNYVIINQNRWVSASESWNQAGGSLRDYRNMVINHETGHWLGHGHQNCTGVGQLAPLMQQQSIDLQGCKFNPWPLNSELWSSR